MNTFELQTKINANRALDFADKAILNQVISYINNNKIFHATNEYLAECWGTNTTAIKRAIRTLKEYSLIIIKNERRKHQQGDKAWYNKRYIEVDFKALEAFLEGKAVVDAPSPIITSDIAVIEPEQTVEDNEPVLGVFPEQNNEYTQMLAELEGKITNNTKEYDHQAVLELIKSDETLTNTVIRVEKEGKIIDENYTSGLYTYVIQKNESYIELYRAIISKIKHKEVA